MERQFCGEEERGGSPLEDLLEREGRSAGRAGAGEATQEAAGREAQAEAAVIALGTSVYGDVASQGDMDVAGAIQGKIDILGKLRVSGHVAGDSRAAQVHADGAVIHGGIDSRGSVEIGAGSVVIGGITAKSAVIAGAVKGDIDVEGPLVLGPSAVVLGSIRCRLLRIQDGAVLEGRCSTDYAQVSPASFFEGYGPGTCGQGKEIPAASAAGLPGAGKEKDAPGKEETDGTETEALCRHGRDACGIHPRR